MIVVDASAAVSVLLDDGQARRTLGEEQLHVPHLIDVEVASALRRRVLADQISDQVGWRAPVARGAGWAAWLHLATFWPVVACNRCEM